MEILVIDDSSVMQRITEKAIRGAGYDEAIVEFASDGLEALAKVTTSEPDIIICDYNMPHLNGYEVLVQLRKKGIDSAFILITVTSDEELAAKVNQEARARFLKKPFTSSGLGDLITEVLAQDASQLPEGEQADEALPVNPSLFESMQKIQRILSGLSENKISIEQVGFSDLNFELFPFYACTIRSGHENVLMALCVDVNASNMIATVMGQRSLDSAIESASLKEIDKTSKQLLLAFVTLFCGLYLPEGKSMPLSIRNEGIIVNTNGKLSSNMEKKRDKTFVYRLSIEDKLQGNIAITYMG